MGGKKINVVGTLVEARRHKAITATEFAEIQ
jgi:hypothetical protein